MTKHLYLSIKDLKLSLEYGLGLALILIAAQVNIAIPGLQALNLGDLFVGLGLIASGFWLGYTWHDKRLKQQRQDILWRLLTPREQEVAALLRLGKTNSEISVHLFIENNTVKTHLKNIYRKTNTHGRQEFRNLFEHGSA